ncbi:MAG: hypothetical protein RIR11_627 [Bacteroidota bacterium]|jgi:hypothetical protein
MARLTAFSRLLIALLIVGGIYFAARTFMPGMMGKIGGGGTTTETSSGGTTTDGGTAASSDNTGGSATSGGATAGATTSFAKQAFTFTPTAPINGKKKGVVELGATGFNSFIIRVDDKKNWAMEKADFGASLVYEKMATDQDIKDGLKQYISDMVGYGVSPRDIHFVISSGAQKVDITAKFISTLSAMKYQVNTVTAEQEGQLALRSVLPSEYSGRAFVVDIGSGNTKISWRNQGQVTALEAAGAKYFQNGTSAAVVAEDVKAKASRVPKNLTSTCFIIGGVPFEFAKKIRNGKERYTVLPAPSEITAAGDKQIAGLNIYNSIAAATGCKQFVFDWDANFTIGFLLGL